MEPRTDGANLANRLAAFFDKILIPQYQILWIIIIFAIIVFGIAYQPYISYSSQEKEAQIYPITPQKVKEWGGTPTRVSVGLYIKNFPTFDLVNNDFVFDGIVWFDFDPALISLNTVSKFVFEGGDIVQQSEPYTQVIENKIFARYNIRVRLKQNFEFSQFPFDDHRMDITIANRSIQPSEMIFRAYSSFFKLAQEVHFPGFQVSNQGVVTGFKESALEEGQKAKTVSYPVALFSIHLWRRGVRNTLLILLPLFMIYFLGLFTFSFDPEKSGNLLFALASAGVTSLLGYRFVIEGMTPHVGYFVFSDYIFTLLLAAVLVIFVVAVIALHIGKKTPALSIARGIIYILMNLIVLAAMTLFFYL